MANGTIAASQLEMLTQSGTGIITIVPPATNTNRTLTLPDATGTVLTTATQLIGTGTTTNNNAASGVVGEYVSSTVASGSRVVLTSGTPADVTSISLTAGDWDVGGIAGFTGISGVSTVAFVGANAGTASGGISPAIGIQVLMNGSTQLSTVADMTAALPVYRYSLASTTTIYLVARCSYTTGSIGAFGTISARRAR